MATSKTRAAGTSIAANTILIILKIAAGLITGSVSLIAEAIHSVMDLVAAIVAFISVKVSDQPADKEHQFGHGKAENLSGVFEGILILVAAGLIIYEGIVRIIHGESLQIIDVGIVVMGASIVVNFFVSRYLKKVSAATDSLALEADAAHHNTDVLTMVGVFAGLILVRLTHYTIIDPIVAIAVALIIIKAAVDIIRKSYGGLMDVSLPDSELKAIEDCLRQHKDLLVDFHRLRTRKAGSQRQIDLHLVISKSAHVEEAHKLCDHLETDIEKLLQNVEVNIHVEPCSSDCNHCKVVCDSRSK